MIERNGNNRLQFVGSPNAGVIYKFEGKDYRFERHETDGRASFCKNGIYIEHMFLVEVSDCG